MQRSSGLVNDESPETGGRARRPQEAITQGGIVYILRTYPELSETFIRREIHGLMGAGVPVAVIALQPGEGAELSGARGPGEPAPPVRYVRSPRPASLPEVTAARTPTRRTRLLVPLARDLAYLRGHPRRSARCLRLAFWALRACRWLPEGTRRLHAHFANDASALARYVSVLSGIPYAVTAHAYDLYQDPFLLGPNLASAHRVHAVSRANLDFLRARARVEGWEEGRLSLLRCGLDLSAFPYRDPAAPRTPARLLCVARLVPKKGHSVLVDALAELLATGAQARLVVAGQGPQGEVLRAQVGRLGLGGSVELLGAVPDGRVPDLMRDSDLVVLASRVAEDGDRDGLPVSLVEASALGIPVVSTEVSGIPELVTPETGWLVPPDRPDLLAAAIRAAIEEPLDRRIGRARLARRKVEEEFDLRRQVETLRSL